VLSSLGGGEEGDKTCERKGRSHLAAPLPAPLKKMREPACTDRLLRHSPPPQPYLNQVPSTPAPSSRVSRCQPPPMAFCGCGSIVVQAKQHPASRPAGPVAHPMQGFWGLAWMDMYMCMCGCIHRRVRGLSTTCAWGQPTNPTVHPVLGALQSSCAVRTLC
jgi:hypothetical protein